MSSIFAIREKEPLVPGTPRTLPELEREIKQLNSVHHIVAAFAGYRAILPHVTDKSDATYFLVKLDPVALQVDIKGFKKAESKQANSEYVDAEKALPIDSRTQIVLVSVASVNALKRAYPNYFLDTDDFLKEVLKVVF